MRQRKRRGDEHAGVRTACQEEGSKTKIGRNAVPRVMAGCSPNATRLVKRSAA